MTYFASTEALSSTIKTSLFCAAVQRVLRHYSVHNKGWLVAGWFKRGYNQDGTPSSEVNMHVTMVRPKSVMPDAPVFTLEQGAERGHNFEAPRGARRQGVDGYVLPDEEEPIGNE